MSHTKHEHGGLRRFVTRWDYGGISHFEPGFIDLESSIRLAAYHRWEHRGRPLWDADTDWIEAEKEFHG